MNIEETLARTALLVRLDVFPDLDHRTIVRGLANTHVRLVADHATAASAAGQTALTAALVSIAQSGANVHLDVPDVKIAGPQPPLRGHRLAAALIELAANLVFPVSIESRPVDIAFVFGDVSPRDAREVIHVQGDDWGCRLGDDPMSGVCGELPFGGLLAGVAIGAESLRCTLRRMAVKAEVRRLAEHDLNRPGEIALRLPALPSVELDVGTVNVVSAGAITNAALFALLRWPGSRGRLRVIDADIVAESNLNRYALLRRSDLRRLKVEALGDYSTPQLAIESIKARLTKATSARLLPLSERVLVGVDDIPSRWLVAQYAPGWVCVAGTTHFAVVVSEHVLGGPCAGCLHPRDDPGVGDIPTASFVSQLAGFLQAHRLLARGYGVAPSPPVLAAPFNLGVPRALTPIGMPPRQDCPVGCAASRRLTDPDATAQLSPSLSQ